MAALLNDGSIPYGSKVFTINSVTYVAEDISIDDAAQKIDRKNEVGEPSGRVLVQDYVEGTATLQLASTSTAPPTNGMTFTQDLQHTGTNQTWALLKISPTFKQDEAQKVNVSFYKKIN